MDAGYRGTVRNTIKAPKGWPAPTYTRTWSESEALEMSTIFALDDENRYWDDLAEDAEQLARIDMGLVL